MRLITERDVRALPGRDPIVVDDETVITPSALDLARERGIAVLFTRGRSSTSAPDLVPPAGGAPLSPAGGGAPSFAEILTRDGVYLVRVEGGKAMVYRVTSSGLEPAR